MFSFKNYKVYFLYMNCWNIIAILQYGYQLSVNMGVNTDREYIKLKIFV